MSLSGSKVYYLVESSALPEVYHKVIKTKELLESGQAATVSEAVAQTGLSRSAFYKYKDVVFTFHEKSQGRVVSLSFTLRDEPGVVERPAQRLRTLRLQRAHAAPGAALGRHGHLHRVCRDAQRHHVKRRAHRPAHHGQGRARMQGSWQ